MMSMRSPEPMSAQEPPQPLTIRPLSSGDLAALVDIDKAVTGRSRRGFYEKRLAHVSRDPSAFIAVAAERRGRVVGFAIARLYEGEFGATAAEAALDAIGVAAGARLTGVGHGLVDAMTAAMRVQGIKELSTEVDWAESALAAFFARRGFYPAPRLVLERAVATVEVPSRPPPRPARSVEIDYSGASGDDFEPLSRDRLPIRSMTKGDIDAMLRIDRHLTGRDRTAYFRRKLAEALDESGVRVSLVAEVDRKIAGFVMARTEFGEFGSLEPEAVIDTIGVDTSRGHRGVGTALISQLMTNLSGLRVERVRTEVPWNQFGLLSFFDRLDFGPRHRLALRRALA